MESRYSADPNLRFGTEKVKKKKNTAGKIVLLLFVAVVAVALIAAGVVGVYKWQRYNSMETYGQGIYAEGYNRIEELSEYRANEEGIAITVESGDGIWVLAKNLNQLGVIDDAQMFRDVAERFGFMDKLKPGTYWIKWGTSYKEMLTALCGESMKIKVTIPEYFSIKQIAERLEENNLIKDADKFVEYTNEFWEENKNNSEYPFLADTNAEGKMFAMEGYLYPATYDFPYGVTRKEIVEMMLEAFNAHYTDKMQKKADELGLSTEELVILASMVEREAANESEMKRIAGVFMNRIEAGMLLQSCACIDYVYVNDDDPNTEHKLRLDNNDTAIESPYNTYKYAGLPVGAICNPGVNSIEAVLNYEKHDYYYFFVNFDKNKSVFSTSSTEHAAKVAEQLG